MLRKNFCIIPLGMIFLVVAGCQKDEIQIVDTASETIKSYPNVDQELWVYFQKFEQEAATRGLHVDLRAQGITGKIEQIDEQHVAGLCQFSSRQPNVVVIDKDFWDRGSELYREFIVFHELGHCSLFRDHREDAYDTGICKSIMRSGLGDCRDQYNSVTRPVYLDELFLYDDSVAGN